MKLEKLINDMLIIAEKAGITAGKFEIEKNNAAGTRVRKAMQEIKKIANDIRATVTDIRNERKGA